VWLWGQRRRTFRLGRGQSTFLGFPPRVPRHLVQAVDVRRGGPEPQLAMLEDCLCVPRARALYRLDGSRIDQTMPTWLGADVPRTPAQRDKLTAMEDQRSPAAVAVPAAPVEVTEPVLFLGSIFVHYGHFLTDSMARAWALVQADPAMKVVFAPARRLDDCPPFVAQILAALGVGPERVIQSDAPLLLRRVIAPEPLIQWDRRVHAGFDAPHRAAADTLAAGTTADARPVYLSRRRLGAGFRQVLGEDKVEARLEREGFAVVHPETLSLGQQIALFEAAPVIVAAEGSALHTLLFRRSERPLRQGVLTWSRFNGRFLLQDALKPVDSVYMRCLDEAGEAKARSTDQSFRLDPERALDLLSTAGFLRRPRPSTGSG
jgi:capsular polysaccharide biosynthesis protein